MIALLLIALFVFVIGLKLWACWWLYHFVVVWMTGVTPSFWSFVWAIILVGFVLSSTNVKSND